MPWSLSAASRRLAAAAALMLPVTALLPAIAWAAETVEHAEEHGGGMPQLDPSTYTSQIFWLIVFFAMLYFGVVKKAMPGITGVLAARDERIALDLSEATRLRGEAEAAFARHETLLAEAHGRARSRIKEVQDRIAREQAERLAALDADLGKQVRGAEERIAKARDAALAEIEDVAIEAAQAATQRLIGVKVSKADTKAALAAARGEAA